MSNPTELYDIIVRCSGSFHSVLLRVCTLPEATKLIEQMDELWNQMGTPGFQPPLQHEVKESLAIWEGCDIEAKPKDSSKPTLFFSDDWEVL